MDSCIIATDYFCSRIFARKNLVVLFKDNRLKYILIMQKLNIVVSILCVLLYVTYLGAYEALEYSVETESSIYIWERMHVSAIIGGMFSLSVFAYMILKNSGRMKASIVALITALVRLFFSLAPYPFVGFVIGAYSFGIGPVGGIGRLVYTYEAMEVMGDYFPLHMVKVGIAIFVLIALMDIAIVVIALVQIKICKVKHIKAYDDFDIGKDENNHKEYRKIRVLNVCFGIIMVFCLTAVSMFSLIMLEGYTVPVVMLVILCDNWIKNKKWLYASISYVVSGYIVYSGLMYVLSAGVPKALQMFNQNEDKVVSLCMGLSFVIIAIIIVLAGVVDNVKEKEVKEEL